MVRINQIKLPINHSKDALKKKICKMLHLEDHKELTYKIVKKSIDARKKPDIFYIYSVDVYLDYTQKQIHRLSNNNILLVSDKKYQFPQPGELSLTNPIVIIGAGPAGLFAAFLLTEMGYCPHIIERGKDVDERMKDVSNFWETGSLNLTSNVQFGEGGAGTFSDGKLNTVVKDPNCRNHFVLETFVRFGAPEEILYDNKPHIGTDILCKIIKNMRTYLTEKGCTYSFDTCATDFIIHNQKLEKIITNKGEINAQICILAVGHSARDTFEKLHELQLPMSSKEFAVGFRVEHPQSLINTAMYGQSHMDGLKAAPYKVTANFPNNRGVYSFCMCPGGFVVNASSQDKRTVVNGMSYSGRDSQNANSAIIVSVGQRDFDGQDPLCGMRYQMKIEEAAFSRGQQAIPQQLFGDFCENKESVSYGAFHSQTKGKTAFCNLRGIFSPEIEATFIDGMNHFEKIIPGFSDSEAILSGVESRTSSPIRIHRDEYFESQMKGIYPCGEGAGFAGGIMSAAMDGLKVAEAIIKKYHM